MVRTPWITSQKVGGKTTQLFKIHRRSHGAATNYEFKVVIDNIITQEPRVDLFSKTKIQ